VASIKPSGPNHHFLPRFLQRGFASGKKGKNPFVFYFDRNGTISERQISNVGADEYFYGHPSDSPVDEQLKLKENEFGLLIFELRNKRYSEPISGTLLPELFAHMAVRTKNLRDGFASAAEQLMDLLAAQSETPEGKARLQRKIQEMVDVELEKRLQEEPARSSMEQLDPELRTQLKAQLRAKLQTMDLSKQFGSLVRQITPMLDFAKMAGDGHVKALAKLENALPPRIETLKPLSWSLIVKPLGTFILGDITVMARHKSGGFLESPLKEKDTPDAIFLPISDRHLLHGSCTEPSTDLDCDIINQASAELSDNFFIASLNTEREKRYLSQLGKRAGLLTADELAEISREIV
jgi:hypothetical protein